MGHYSRLSQIVIDVPPADHDGALQFWEAATGGSLPPYDLPEYHGAELPDGRLNLLVQRLETGDARVHLDMHTDDLEAEVRRLEELGAERVRQVHSWWVMRDTAGLAFCVIPARTDELRDRNARWWE